MAISKKDRIRAQRRALRVSSKIKRLNFGIPRIVVFRSLKHIYAQIIDDKESKTLVSYSSLLHKNTKGDKKSIAQQVGSELAKRALEHGIEKVVFDRGKFAYHGRIKALAEGVRDGGLRI